MSELPPSTLIATLEGLGLSNATAVRRVRGRVRRLSRELPAFDQVWIDALVQARRITPFQAEWLAEGKAERLAVGEYLLCERLGGSDLGETFRARRRQKRREQVAIKRLRTCDREFDAVRERIEQYVASLREIRRPDVSLPRELICKGEEIYLVEPFVSGPSPIELLVHRGRIEPRAVVEIARQLLAAMAVLDEQGLCHGDLRPSNLRLSERGIVVVTDWGLRGSVPGRQLVPERGLPPERFDYQAPERLEPGHRNQVSGDLYALGCVLFHLLAGRPPFPGDALAKVMAHRSRRVLDVRELVPDTPEILAELIRQLTAPNPAQRAPQGLGPLRASLVPPTRRGRRTLARYLGGKGWRSVGRRPRPRASPAKTALVVGLAAVAIGLAFVSALGRERFDQWAVEGLAIAERLLPAADGPERPPGTPPTVAIHGSREPVFDPSMAQVDSSAESNDTGRSPAKHSDSPDPIVKGRRQIIVSGQPHRFSQGEFAVKEIDFRFNPPPSTPNTREPAAAALIEITAASARFEGCRFFGTSASARQPSAAAILWEGTAAAPASVEGSQSALSEPATLVFKNCIFDGVTAAVAWEAGESATVRFVNCLLVGGGSFVSFADFPRAGRRVMIQFEGCTLRESDAAIEFDGAKAGDGYGEVETVAEDSVFAARTALLLFASRADDVLVERIRWKGLGALIPPNLAVAERVRAGQKPRLRLASLVRVEGIVPARIEFQASRPEAIRPAGSMLQDAGGAPSLSGRLPGVDAAALPTGE